MTIENYQRAKANPLVLDKAADYIEKNGWYNDRLMVRGHQAMSSGECIGLAVTKIKGWTYRDLRALAFHLSGTEDFSEIYRLNDEQPLAEGKDWAVNNLRELARKLRNADPA